MPIFIVGVPRSGTTLVRVLLGSHSQILALPETPWLTGAYGRELSLRELLQGLASGPYGPVRNVAGIEAEDVLAAGRHFLEALYGPVLKARGKNLLAFKTPADIRHLDFLTELMPGAFYVHITRDGRDVALSQLSKKGSFFKDLKEYRRLSFANAFRRWVDWEQRARSILARDGVRAIHVRYEDLVACPERELCKVTDFIGLPFESRMLDYASSHHDLPVWEAGSTDVAERKRISDASVGKWRAAKVTPEMLHTLMRYDHFLVQLGYPSSGLKPGYLDRLLAAGVPWINTILDAVSRVPNPVHQLRWTPR